MGDKKLVAFFSAGGVTAGIARKIVAKTGADIFEIAPVEEYTAADLDWTDPESRTSIKVRSEDTRPPLAEKLESLDGYDTVFLGFPIWWYREPRIVDTFIESCDVSGKKIVLFATSGMSGFGDTKKFVSKIVPTAKVEETFVMHGDCSESELASIVARG